MTELWQMGALGLSAMIARREISPVDLMRDVLGRIGAVNGAVNAIVALRDRETLMGEARLAEAMPPDGWLHGIPVAVKDLVGVRGVPSSWGSPILKDNVPLVDDGLARRLRAAGAIIIGKTNVPAFGLGSHTVNPVYGATRNPYDPSKTAGGSSGGAAVALATRMLALADGSDMMGSLRNPAAWNNVYGFRPTAGLVPGEPRDSVFQHRLSTDGPMARDIDDLEHLLATLSDGAYRPGQGPVPRRPRIGWLGDWGGAYAMEPGILDLCRGALAVFEDMGAVVEDVAPPFPATDLWHAWITIRAVLNAGSKGALYADPAKRAQIKPETIWEIERGLGLTAEALHAASVIRSQWFARAARLFATYDALVLPSAQVWPFPADWRWPQTIGARAMDTYHRWMEVVIPVSLAGLPALACPAGFGPQGLPMGFQIFGPVGADARILALGHQYHLATEWPGKRPPPI
jgi:amidase